MQHRCPILKLDLAGRITVGSYSNLVGVTIIKKAPICARNEFFANLFSDPDEWALDRTIAVGPEVYLAGVKKGINPIGPTEEQRGFAHYHPLRKASRS